MDCNEAEQVCWRRNRQVSSPRSRKRVSSSPRDAASLAAEKLHWKGCRNTWFGRISTRFRPPAAFRPSSSVLCVSNTIKQTADRGYLLASLLSFRVALPALAGGIVAVVFFLIVSSRTDPSYQMTAHTAANDIINLSFAEFCPRAIRKNAARDGYSSSGERW